MSVVHAPRISRAISESSEFEDAGGNNLNEGSHFGEMGIGQLPRRLPSRPGA